MIDTAYVTTVSVCAYMASKDMMQAKGFNDIDVATSLGSFVTLDSGRRILSQV
jgi:hypothetical protein